MRGAGAVTNFTVRVALLLLAAATALAAGGALAEVQQTGTVTTLQVRYNASANAFSVTEGALFGPVAATLRVNDSFSQTGWDVVEAAAAEAFLDSGPRLGEAERLRVAYQAMGYGEGYATQLRMEQTLNNTFLGEDGLGAVLRRNPQVEGWVEKHLAHMNTSAAAAAAGDEYGQQLKNMLSLLDGLLAGYNDRVRGRGPLLNRTWLFYLNFQEEVGDVARAVTPAAAFAQLQELSPRFLKDLHCSALVKLTPYDIFFSHVTWSSFNTMLRQYKTYRVGARSVTMTSYPGAVHSIDDWYMTHARLAVMETTNGVSNRSLFAGLSPNTVSEFLRVMIANFLATDSPSWVKYFARNNSGTYNNQWMVLNLGAVRNPGAPLPANTFWVAEQLPSSADASGVTAADMTEHLRKHGYWASYNIPYFENVYNVSGYPQKVEKKGDFFSYTKCPRARMFKRNHSDVVDLESMKRLMRYNNYKEDELSRIQNCKGAGTNNTCDPPYSAMLAIASRGDLNPPGNTTNYGPLAGHIGHINHGATDAKIGSWSGMVLDPGHYTAHVVCGPTSDQQPPFLWKEGLFTPMPEKVGLPDLYNFSFVTYTTDVFWDHTDKENTRNKWIGIGIGIGAAGLVLVSIAVVIFRAHRRAKLLSEETLLAQ
ncbi:putative lysosomal/endosomal membrane protein p67, putative,lysosomal membrane glycoprotein [Trypanosoma conorhini]|uniref:Phospholipase B-like n=1 Tax=Trypanosoma conorhini TaxID=83891 RepID=A0A3R7N558_9TRYP|nr:putative lysosomal/endosomal membrane protein p67, putative,lysosomal membrane glycoprotein [Trypanosoma conorhini]RNF25577.1 putative lysosomal/endosomal membrane protein p67, putative,lysosomal membrane glycoprotein [Trypanosoma conorhini]